MGDSQVFRSWLHTWLQLLVVSWLQKKLKIRVLCYTCCGTHILYNIYTFTHSFMLEYDPFHIYEYKKIYIMSPLIFYGPFIFHLTWYITSILCALSCLSYFFAGFFLLASFSFLLLKICDGAKDENEENAGCYFGIWVSKALFLVSFTSFFAL